MLKMLFSRKRKEDGMKKNILLNKTKSLNMPFIPLPRGEYVEVHEQKKKALNCKHSILKRSSSQKIKILVL